jgi:CheY-like chemotaxis protein
MKIGAAANQELFHILLVDDNEHGLIARKAVLEELHYTISTAHSGEEALELLAAHKFDLIVTDYKMPNMNGVELIKTIRISDSTVPVVLLSGFVEPLGLDEKTTGADVVISKSAGEVGHLVRAVNRLLRPPVKRKPPSSQKSPPKGKANKA